MAQHALGGVQVQGLEQSPHRGQQDHRERQRAGDGGGLQGAEAVGQQQGDGHHADRAGPEDPLPQRGVVAAAGGEHVDHQRAGVCRGDEEHHHHQHRQQRQHRGEGELLEEGEQRQRAVLANRVGQAGQALLHDHVDGAVAEHGHPQQGEAGGDEQHAADELADGPPARHAGDEHADERGPGHPPAPVQQGPATEPVGRLVGVQVEGLADDLRQVAAGVLHEGLQQVHGGAEHQHQQEENGGQRQVQLGQAADALVQAGDHRQGGQRGDRDDQADLHPGADRQVEQMVEAAVDLQHAIAQRGGHAEHGAEDGEDVHRVADRTVDALADQRVERRAQGQRQAVAVAEEGEDQRDHGVDRPGVQAPVEEGQLHRLARRLHAVRLADRWGDEVHHRLGDAEEHQADAHAGGEQHGEPGGVAVVRPAVVGAELDVAVAADGEEHHGDQDQGDGEDVEPAGVGDDPALHEAEQALGAVREGYGENHQGQDEQDRGEEHRRIEGGAGARGCFH
ncbi:hypothetical protein D3C75_648080 [compost metagenome]